MGLTLVTGPAHSGKVALLLDRYLQAIRSEPWLIVPNRGDVERVERDLLLRSPVLMAGRIGTFDDLFDELAGVGPHSHVIGAAGRGVLVRRVVADADLRELARSGATRGFADALATLLAELESALVDPEQLDGELGGLVKAFRTKLAELSLVDRAGLRRRALERLRSELGAWERRPVYAYGFEDLTAAEWGLLEALAARCDVTVSLPYEPGRDVFTSLARTASDLATLAVSVEELRPGSPRHLPAPLAHLERGLFSQGATRQVLDGSIRFLEGAGTRGTVELVADAVAELVRSGTVAHEIAIVVDSSERWRATVQAVFGAFGIPFVLEEPSPLPETPFGSALVSLLRYAWMGGTRSDLFRFLRSPYSGVGRPAVDFLEGRLRGRAVREPGRVEEESERLRGDPLPLVGEIRGAPSPLDGAIQAAHRMIRAAHRPQAPLATDASAQDLAAYGCALRVLEELQELEARTSQLGADTVLHALERDAQLGAPAPEPGHVVVLDYLRARTRRFDVVFALGLEEGSMPRRGRGSPFLDDDRRAELGGRLESPDSVDRDRYLFYTACSRPRRRLVLVREAFTDEGSPRESSPFWEEVIALFDPDHVARWTRRRPLSALTWSLEDAPTERERLRALARASVADRQGARALAWTHGWDRRLARAESAFERPTRLENPAVLEWLAQRTTFSVTELERFADCSSAWLFERVVSPKTIDAEPDAMLRGQLAHTTLHRFYQAIPRELGVDVLTPELSDRAVELLRRCLDETLASGVRLDLSDLQAAELRQTLQRDLEGFVRDEAAAPLRFVPRRLELAFGSERAAAELQRGLPLGDGLSVSGKIDRIDLDPFSASGIVQDYKSGKSAHSARDIDRELRLQVPLYLLVLRDLLGIEPLGGVYRALSGKRVKRGMLRAGAADDLPGFFTADYLEDDVFWNQIETARDRAAEYAQRIRAGDVRHDPKRDGCPAWCDVWRMCRVERA